MATNNKTRRPPTEPGAKAELDLSKAQVIAKEDIDDLTKVLTKEQRLAEFKQELQALTEKYQVAIVPFVKQYNTGQHRAEVEFVAVDSSG